MGVGDLLRADFGLVLALGLAILTERALVAVFLAIGVLTLLVV
jgi:hypothetical protein